MHGAHRGPCTIENRIAKALSVPEISLQNLSGPERPEPFYYGRAPTVHEMDWIHLWDWIERVPVIVRCARCDRDVYGRLPAPSLVPASPP